MAHNCHAINCQVAVPRSMLMCRKHWSQVPKEIQNQVWMHYQNGQEVGAATPSRAWHDAADRAIKFIFEKEKKREEDRERIKNAPRLPGL